jgi:sensor histidine kinase YesM
MKKSVIYYVIRILLSFPFGLIALYIFCPVCFSNPLREFIPSYIYSISLFIILPFVFDIGFDYLDKKHPWERKPYKKFYLSLIFVFVCSAVSFIIINFIFYIIYWKRDISFLVSSYFIGFLFKQILISYIFYFVIQSWRFLKLWRQVAVNEETFKREKLALQYEALKNQVNPHFLFNSLNVLTSLVYKDPDMSARFIKNLSDVYRYVLDLKDKELITLDEELSFVEHYIYLQKIRFTDSLEVQINNTHSLKGFVVPVSLQMVIENAIKHNVVSPENPLLIIINIDNDYIIVKNKLQKKSILVESTSIGLGNIRSRYEIMTDKPFTAEEIDDEFVVKIPIIYESTNN